MMNVKFVIATHNKHKVTEFARILEPLGIEISVESLTEAEETGDTFEKNAYIKAKSACDETGLPSIADDSGLCVDYLGGAPGIYSARFASPGHRKLTILEKLEGVPEEDRGAHFVSAISCVFPNGDTISATGICSGKIAFSILGAGGFGYDPIFMYGDRTFGQITDAEKDLVSHRGVALRKFEEKLRKYLSQIEG